MPLISCPSCASDDDILVTGMSQGVKKLRCGLCGAQWDLGPPARQVTTGRSSFDRAKGRFATEHMVAPERRKRVAQLKVRFLGGVQSPSVELDHWAQYRPMLTREGLRAAHPDELRAFTQSVAVRYGRPGLVRRAWDTFGEEEAAARSVTSLAFLLHGSDDTPLEDRLTLLIAGDVDRGLPGLTETFHMHVLHVASPRRFMPAMGYSAGDNGKQELARTVFGLHLPRVDTTSMQIGRQATWSNDLLVTLAGPGFRDTEQMVEFLLWARGRVERRATVRK